MIQTMSHGSTTVNGIGTANNRFPPEILSAIFTHLADVDPLSISPSAPPTGSPIILGRVCSQWRSVSRSSQYLWGNHTIYSISWHASNLGHLLDILPPSVCLSILFFHNLDENLAPYLHRFQSFIFRSAGIDHLDDLFIRSSPHNFTNLRSLKLNIIEYWPDDDKRVYRSGEHYSASTMPPFSMATELHTVEIESNSKLWRVLQFSGLPWAQLKVLDLRVRPEDISPILSVCRGLVKLRVGNHYGIVNGITACDVQNILLHDLEQLELEGACFLIPAIDNWDRLTKLELRVMSLSTEQLHDILLKCTKLTELHCDNAPSEFPLLHLPMPHLQCLSLHASSTALGPLNHFFLPSLQRLTLSLVSPHACISLVDLIRRSGCPLVELTITISQTAIKLESLRDVLSAISPTVKAVICPDVIVEGDILRDIGAGRLLPELLYLSCKATRMEEILEMMDARRTMYFRASTMSLTDVQVEQARQFCLARNIPIEISNFRDIFIGMDLR